MILADIRGASKTQKAAKRLAPVPKSSKSIANRLPAIDVQQRARVRPTETGQRRSHPRYGEIGQRANPRRFGDSIGGGFREQHFGVDRRGRQLFAGDSVIWHLRDTSADGGIRC